MKGEKKIDFYQSAIKNAPIGYACNKIICDENGEPYDYEYVDVNAAFAGFFGMEEKDLIGTRYSELSLQLFDTMPGWIRLLGEIALTGGEKEAEEYSELLGGWTRIKVTSPGKDYFFLYILGIPKETEPPDERQYAGENIENWELMYRSVPEEKGIWEKRLQEIADMLRLENDQQFQRIIESLPFSLDISTLDGVILYANAKFLELFELDRSVVGTGTRDDLWADREKQELWIESLGRDGIVNDFEMHLKTARGKELWAIGSGIIIQYQGRTCVLSTQFDITERKSMESALKVSEEKYRLLTEFTSDVIWVLDLKKQKYSYISPSIYHLTGYTPEEALKLNLTDSLTPESAMIVREAIETQLQEFMNDPEHQKSYILEIRQKCKNGEVIWVEISLKYRRNDAGDIEIVGVSRNIEERKKAEREVLYLSYHDQLTGLYNRRFYEEELQRMNFQRNMPLTMVIADVNGLKLTNDAFGHLAGDDLLRKFAAVINQELRAEDTVARIGGDEFAILLPRTDSAGAEALVNRIRERVQSVKPENAILSVSFGWATKETVEEDFDAMFIQAEDNMYHTKLIESAMMKNETIQLAMRRLYQKSGMEQLHSERVGKLCREIGKAMNLTEGELWELELLGRMHDIGKVGVPAEILNKQGSLNETEWMEIRRHPEIGYQILRSADEYVQIAEAVLTHHERIDGKGYPRKLKPEDIPIQARILSVAEAYDAMIHGSFYKNALSERSAVKELIEHSDTQFDRNVVEVLIDQVIGNKDKPEKQNSRRQRR